MAEDIEKADLYRRNHGSYYLLYSYLAALYLLTWWLIFQGTWWGILVGSCTIGAFWGQLAFIGHDLGHTCVHNSRWMDCFAGFLVNSFLGIGVSHWVDNHNAHHCVVNSSDCDPEVQVRSSSLLNQPFLDPHSAILPLLPTLVLTLTLTPLSSIVQFMPFIAPSTLHFEHTRKGMTRLERALSCISKTLISYQHLSFIPLLLFARYKFYFQSLGHLAIGRKVYINWYSELFAEVFFLSWVTLMTLQLPTWQMRLAWVLLSHASDFILYLQTVITHFPREISPGVKTDWIESQAVGTLNWFSPPELDWYHGGLQWQIEHHLFPRIPRHNLREASKIVRPVLKELGIEYHSPTFIGAIVETFESLKVVAMEARLPLAPWIPSTPSVPLCKIIPKATGHVVAVTRG